jgi:hypothetical protein
VYLTLSVKNVKDTALKKRIIEKWFVTECEEVSMEIIDEMYQIFKKYHVPIRNWYYATWYHAGEAAAQRAA